MSLQPLPVFVHELGHLIAGKAVGVDGYFSLGMRLYIPVAETNLTQLWTVPRKKRFVPFLAGMLNDALLVSVFVILLWLSSLSVIDLGGVAPFFRLSILLLYYGLVWQFLLFIRTDLYYAVSNLCGCRNLYADSWNRILKMFLGVELKAKTNNGSFDDPRGLGANTSDVRFGSPISITEIVFAARREPIAKRVVVDVAFDVMAKGFKVHEESENPRPEWTRQVSKILDELDTKERLRELTLFERLYGWAALGVSYVDYGDDPSKPVQDPKKIISLTVFSDHNSTVMDSDVEKNEESERAGQPNLYTIKFGSTTKKIHYTRMIHFASRRMGHPWLFVIKYPNVHDAFFHIKNPTTQIFSTSKKRGGVLQENKWRCRHCSR